MVLSPNLRCVASNPIFRQQTECTANVLWPETSLRYQVASQHPAELTGRPKHLGNLCSEGLHYVTGNQCGSVLKNYIKKKKKLLGVGKKAQLGLKGFLAGKILLNLPEVN